jgi:hypothetical protein
MSFVTVKGSTKLNWDITYDRFDPKTGDQIQDGNSLKSLDLTDGEHFDFNPNGSQMKEFIQRGQPNVIDMNWNEMPVYKVLTPRFKTGHEFSECKQTMRKTDWGRFMRDYERQKFKGGDIYYEPEIEDIRKDPENNKAFPMWVIDKLIELGEFDQALKVGKVNLPSVPRLTKTEYQRIMKEIELRREEEAPKSKEKVAVGNISGNLKSSKS